MKITKWNRVEKLHNRHTRCITIFLRKAKYSTCYVSTEIPSYRQFQITRGYFEPKSKNVCILQNGFHDNMELSLNVYLTKGY